MSEEATERLNDGNSFEVRVLSELATLREGLMALREGLMALNGRVSVLEEKVDARLSETRPIWESVLEKLKLIDAKFDVHAHDMLEMRGEINLIKKRLPPAA